MRFPLPLLPAEFEIPDDWWCEAGMEGFRPPSNAYHSSSEAKLILLREIEPPSRFPECPLDFRGFNRKRMICILAGFVNDAEIEAVPVLDLPSLGWPLDGPFRYRVRNGVHRFYASVAAGFDHLPVTKS
jgi:hypothetical protein